MQRNKRNLIKTNHGQYLIRSECAFLHSLCRDVGEVVGNKVYLLKNYITAVGAGKLKVMPSRIDFQCPVRLVLFAALRADFFQMIFQTCMDQIFPSNVDKRKRDLFLNICIYSVVSNKFQKKEKLKNRRILLFLNKRTRRR